ncbi:MAG: hypothetical protein Q9216_005089 [Gyalolechia sp. 2 TL-2023]
MALVNYTDSDDSEEGAATYPKNGLKRKRGSKDERQADLPPLPDGFYNLYASNTRISKNDDPSLHAGRQRQMPHVEGQWPTHVYIEWHPSRLEIKALSEVLTNAERKVPPGAGLHSLLKSELGADQPLHISLSRTLMLATEKRQSFINDLQVAIKESSINPFAVVLSDLSWVANYENNRWFLVVHIQKPRGNELNKLLEASNEVARKHQQPPLYVSQEIPAALSRTPKRNWVPRPGRGSHKGFVHGGRRDYLRASGMYEDASAHFHVSIGWSLEKPSESLLEEDVSERSLQVNVQDIKVKVGLAAHECVSEDALVHLKSYKYSSVDKSLLSKYILKHYWNGFVELLPLWLAPNMVTLLGFGCILVNVILLEIFIPDLIGPAPSWLYYSFALGIWMYSTMDNVDGKQARRTGQSSGLGELFDLCETAALGLGSSPKGVFTALIPCLPMFFSTWETYHTHTLYLGYFNGPTEGLIIACSMMTLSGYYGPQIWTQPITDLIAWPAVFGSASVVDIWIPVIFGTFLFIHLPACVLNVVDARRAKGLPITPLLIEWLPITVFTASCAAWLYSPYSTLMQENRLVLFCLTMSFVFGRMTTKIILAHLTRQPFPLWTVMLVPLLGGAILGNLPRLGLPAVTAIVELWYLRAYFGFALVVYFRWALLVINSICAYLGINCLTITPAPAPNQTAVKGTCQNGTPLGKQQAANGGWRRKAD